jgi:hypothetical protein
MSSADAKKATTAKINKYKGWYFYVIENTFA